MKTKLENIKELGLRFLATTTVWDYHNVDIRKIAANKKSNLHTTLKSFIGENMPSSVVVFVGKKGWSQHNATDLHIFQGHQTAIDAIDSNYHSFYEINLHMLFNLPEDSF